MHMIIITELCLGHVYIYLNPLGHTLKSFASIEYEFDVLIEERGRLQNLFGEVLKWFHYITDGSGRVRNPTGDIKVLE
jgi:hypothetical protein